MLDIYMVSLWLVNSRPVIRSAAMDKMPSLPLAVRWLATDLGVSDAELAVLSGVSPGAIAGLFGKPNAAILTWKTLLQALHCSLEIRTASRTLRIALPRPSARRRATERVQWHKRRVTAFRAQVVRQSPDSSHEEAQATAVRYADSSQARLMEELAAAERRLLTVCGGTEVPGMRAALRAIAGAAAVNAEDLSLLAGLSLGAAQTAIDGNDEGRLATPHRLLSALTARLVLIPAGGGELPIALSAPGAWRPELPRAGRTSMTHDEIRACAKQRIPLAEIARRAGVSRQRIHAIVRATP